MSSLIKNPNKLLNQDIILEPGRSKNKNKVPQVDRRIQELEEEIRKLSPKEETIAEETLMKAIKAVNDKIRSGNFSANEILFRRKQDQSEITISDKEFVSKIENSRIENHQPSSKSKAKLKIKLKPSVIYPSQLVYLKQEVSKHATRHLYVVTSEPVDDLVCIKKILHFNSANLEDT